jgi:hypothetical protein
MHTHNVVQVYNKQEGHYPMHRYYLSKDMYEFDL